MRKSIWKRALSLVLSLAMLLTLVPAFDVLPEAEAETRAAGPQGNYITLPITIRDFAADGMLFEYNEVGTNNLSTGPSTLTKTDRLYSYTGAAYTMTYNPSDTTVTSATDEKGIYVLSYATKGTTRPASFDEEYYCVIVGQYGDILKVIPAGESKDTYAADMDADYTVNGATQKPYYSVWAREHANNLPQYNLVAKVTEANKNLYRFGFSDSDSDDTPDQIYLGRKYYEQWTPSLLGNKGIFVFAGNTASFPDGGLGNFDWWHCVVIDSDNQVVKVVPNGEDKVEGCAGYLTSEYRLVMAWSDDTNRDSYDPLVAITTENYSEYEIVMQSCDVGGPVLFVERTISVYQADTKGFGLLKTSTTDYLNNLSAESGISGSEFISNNAATNGIKTVNLWDENEQSNPYATQYVHGATIRTNLVTKELDEITGKPLYTEATVEYLAKYLQALMAIPEKTNGAYNTHFVKGTKLYDANKEYVGVSPLAVYDLAEIFRMGVTGLGDYGSSKAKFDGRQLLYPHQATTWYDAAYYLLHMLWNNSPVDDRTGTEGQDGYGMPVPIYNKLHLMETTNEDGDITYVFNAKYDDTTYDYWKGEIYNAPFEGYTNEDRPFAPAYTKSGNTYTVGGSNILPAARFDPLGPSGAGVDRGYTMAASADTYGDFAKNNSMNWAEYYDETNYHLSLEGHAQFVYHYDANQYFTFTGDDDVYLYINGIRVLDVGGAHSIAKVSINLNDIAAKVGLVDGDTYTFDFFFIERHGTAANFGIETNIQIADPSMNTYKTGYQNGVNTGYNGYVNANTHVGYSFEIQNDGSAHIYNLTFDDKDIGVYFGWDNVVLYPENFTDEQKSLYGINDLYMLYRDADGNYTEYLRPGEVTVNLIKERLHQGLEPGERIGIYGFKYDITKAGTIGNGKTWAEDGTFTNTVYTTATDGLYEYTPELNGMSDWKVQKMNVPYTAFHVYDWVHKDAKDTEWETPANGTVTLSKAELLQYLADSEELGLTKTEFDALLANPNVKIVKCTASGVEDEHLQNPCVTVNSDNSITYKSAKPGQDTVFYEIKGTGLLDGKLDNLSFSFDVYTYGTMDNVYVLDYGLKVKLNEDDFGFKVNDKLTVPENIYNPTTTITALKDNTGVYGDFMIASTATETGYKPMSEFAAGDGEKSVEYWPKNIMNNTDSFEVDIEVREEIPDGVTITEDNLKFYGVDMNETVTTAPANVVYYEDDFPGIVYVNNLGNGWVQYETVDDAGDPVMGEYQSADQNSNYGSDPNYGDDKDGWLNTETGNDTGNGDGTDTGNGDNTNDVINPDGEPDETEKYLLDTAKLSTLQKSALNAMQKFLGVGGTDSNGNIHELVVNTSGEVMSFEFVGTGFEILSRTTDEKYAVISVQVQKDSNGDGTYDTVVKHKPVITESLGGDLYQVPIISITNLNHSKYRVVVQAAGSDTGDRVLYIDGIRIYGPLTKDEALEYYNPNEANAEFLEIKKLVKQGKAAYFGVENAEEENGKPYLVSGISYAEDIDRDGLIREITDAGEYMDNGPNNELYLNANGRLANMVAFYLVPDETVSESARTIQIGAHRKVDPAEEAYGYARMTFGSTRDDIVDPAATNYKDIATGTEMYYTVNPEYLLEDENGYLLMIGINAGENDDAESLALTNLKISGYTIKEIEPIVKEAYESGNPENSTFIAELIAICEAMMAVPEEVDGEDDVPEEITGDSEDSGAELSDEEPVVTEDSPDAVLPEETEDTEPEETEAEETADDIAE